MSLTCKKNYFPDKRNLFQRNDNDEHFFILVRGKSHYDEAKYDFLNFPSVKVVAIIVKSSCCLHIHIVVGVYYFKLKMSSDFDKIIRDFSSYFGITVKELTWDENKRVS